MANLLFNFFTAYNFVHELIFSINCIQNTVTPLEASASYINTYIDNTRTLTNYDKEYSKYCVNLTQDIMKRFN